LPEVGEGIAGGTIVGVLVAIGDRITLDQPLLELETDKAVVEVPSPLAGVVQEIAVKENEEAKVGQVILSIEEETETTGSRSSEVPPKAERTVPPSASFLGEETPDQPRGPRLEPAADREVSVAPSARATTAGDRGLVPAAPSVRRLAREMGIDLQQVSGGGILGRVSAQDLQHHLKGEAAPPAMTGSTRAAPVELPDFSRWGEVERRPMSGIRKATVRSMTTAWGTVPMVTHFDKADVTEFEALRKRYQTRAEALGAKLTPTAMIIKVVAAALRRFPDFNASIDPLRQEIIYKRYVNIGVAVDTERGLLVPVIRHADRKNIIELAEELGKLAEKARTRKLAPEEMQGGNFSVSNLGGIGGTGFTPIVNPPDVAILGVSRGRYEPVYNRDTAVFDARLLMPLSVTYDHRLIDGAAAARFLRWVCSAIEEPFLLALEG